MLNSHDEQVLARVDELAHLKADLRRGKITLTDRDKARLKARLLELYGTVLGAASGEGNRYVPTSE